MARFLCVSQLPQLAAAGANADSLAEIQKIFAESAHVICHASLRSMARWLASNRADGILLEHAPPSMNGLQALQDLRGMPACSDTPIFIYTENISTEFMAQCLLSRVTAVVPQPFTAPVLRRCVLEALHNKYLQDNLTKEVGRQVRLAEERLDASRTLFKEMSLALAKAIDAKDKYTSGHSERVANYSREIAKRAGEPDTFQEKVYFIGLLHDVGKIGIPKRIINKAARLSDKEYDTIKQHTIIGSGILKDVDVIPEFAIGAHYHHERYDGHGYPQGLKGEAIPKLARIIAVADAYDAMTSNRSYRDSLSQAVVRAEILKGRGRQFDPQYADIMVEMIDGDSDFQMREKEVSPRLICTPRQSDAWRAPVE